MMKERNPSGWGDCHVATWSAMAGSGVPIAQPEPTGTQPRRKMATPLPLSRQGPSKVFDQV